MVDRALKLPAGERAGYLHGACAGNPELLGLVDRLFAPGGKGTGVLEKPPTGPAAAWLRGLVEAGEDPSAASTVTTSPPGDPVETIGPYRLLQKVGEGGMGEVWLADQTEPVRRKVALKLIKAGMDTERVVARFEAERQALALMDHPAIAKVFDAGATLRGLPYFVMEYVPGLSLTSYCDRHKLPLRERLDLFLRVCEGVQHAHQKGIIHRDLKPSNVLVSLQDGRPVPRIIDFGVAKATGPRLTEKTVFTALGLMIGTPEYMSPEQADMTHLDVDTRTDVYSLGTILYELLTGALPFDPRELRSGGFDELRRRIREVEPPRPSTRVRTLGDRSVEVASRRRTETGKLVSGLKGDLDWIVMKALEKDRTRRYGSPADLAADLERHLSHRPVLAGPPGAAYRAGKFVRRHRFGVAVAAIGVAALLGFAATMAVQAGRIVRERDRANREAEVSRRVSDFLTGLFQVSDPDEARGNTVTAREILDKGAEKIEAELADSPEIQAQLMRTMGDVYWRLGIYGKAEQLLARAVEVLKAALGAEHPDTLASRFRLAWVYIQQGRLDEGERLARETLEAQRRVLGEEHPDVASSMSVLAAACRQLGRLDESERLHRAALEIRRRTLGPEHRQTMLSAHSLAVEYIAQRRWADAEVLLRETLEIQRRLWGSDHPGTLTSMDNLATVYFYQRRFRESEGLVSEVLNARRHVLGSEHPSTLRSLSDLANAYRVQGRYEEAERRLEEALEAQRRLLGPEHRDTLRSIDTLAWVRLDQGRHDEAEEMYRQVFETYRRLYGPTHHDTLGSMYNLACVEASRGRRVQALDWLRQAVEGGYRDPDEMVNDRALGSLHGDPEFDRLVAVARQNARK